MKVSKKMIFGMCAILSASSALAGGQKGNGGAAVVCRNEAGVAISAKLLDLYNAEFLDGLTFNDQPKSDDEILQRARIRMEESANNAFLDSFDEELKVVRENWILLPSGVPVIEAGDAKLAVGTRKNCKTEYVVNYATRNERIRVLVNSDLYTLLPKLDQQALVVHESVYAVARKIWKDEDTERTQEITALLSADSLSDQNEKRLTEMTRIFKDWRDLLTQNTKLVVQKSFRIEASKKEGRTVLSQSGVCFGNKACDLPLETPYISFGRFTDIRNYRVIFPTLVDVQEGDVIDVRGVSEAKSHTGMGTLNKFYLLVSLPNGRPNIMVPYGYGAQEGPIGPIKGDTDMKKMKKDLSPFFKIVRK